jgi:hypothetical protein
MFLQGWGWGWNPWRRKWDKPRPQCLNADFLFISAFLCVEDLTSWMSNALEVMEASEKPMNRDQLDFVRCKLAAMENA